MTFITISFEKTVLGQVNENVTINPTHNASTSYVSERQAQYDPLSVLYGVTAFAVFVIAILRFWIRKSILRAVLGITFLFVSLAIWFQRSTEAASQNVHLFAIFLIFVGLFIVLSKRKKKVYQWKKHNKLRRYFPVSVREQVLKYQHNRCANCDVNISGALINYDHIDGDHSNNDISNCQALCPNCHSLKTEDDRQNQ